RDTMLMWKRSVKLSWAVPAPLLYPWILSVRIGSISSSGSTKSKGSLLFHWVLPKNSTGHWLATPRPWTSTLL
ncbi:hypothetical protein BGZ52_012404, partial [Haplosporangium bisporale]